MVAGKLAAPRGRFDIGALIAHPANSLNLISRQAIKKYVKANNKVQFASETQFDSMFNKALKSGVKKGEFTQPKGTTSRALPLLDSVLRHATSLQDASC